MTVDKPRLFSYVVARDYGFAPNPFFGFCTLATCKPKIREVAKKGDWIIGTSSMGSHKKKKHIVYFMQVTEKLTFAEYWNDKRFERKKPAFDKTEKYAYGDNIYHQNENGEWCQELSHHRSDRGCINERNLNRDTASNHVLVSDNFGYYGSDPIKIPKHLLEIEKHTTGHKSNFSDHIIEETIKWLSSIKRGLSKKPYELITKKKIHDYQHFVLMSLEAKKPERDVLTLGLVSEVGSIYSNIKRRLRDKKVDIIHKINLTEEVGDVLWYITAICCEQNLNFKEMLVNSLEFIKKDPHSIMEHFSNDYDLEPPYLENSLSPNDIVYFDEYDKLSYKFLVVENSQDNVLLDYCYSINLISYDIFSILHLSEKDVPLIEEKKAELKNKLGFLYWHLSTLSTHCNISINDAIIYNENKVKELFIKKISDLKTEPLYDEEKENEEEKPTEKLPRNMTIYFYNNEQGLAYIAINSILLGDPLDDNYLEDDGYRYHDGIHFVIYATLGWSPVWRSFLRRKRKSNKKIDGSQDGARAKIVEEMLVKMIHSYFEIISEGAKIESVDSSFLKNIKILTKGLEIENISYSQWEAIIIKSHEIYYKLWDNGGGKLTINLDEREIEYEKLTEDEKEYKFKSYG